MKRIKLLAATCCLLFSLGTYAMPITYDIDLAVGATGSVTGTLQTDGTIGALSSSNIVDWTFDLCFDVTCQTVNDANAQLGLRVGILAATLTDLVLDFADNFADDGSFTLLMHDLTWSFEAQASGGGNTGGSYGMRQDSPSGSNIAFESVSLGSNPAVVQFASVPVSVPEPGTLALLGLGLAAIGIGRRKNA